MIPFMPTKIENNDWIATHVPYTSPMEEIFSKTPPPPLTPPFWKFQLNFIHFFKILSLENSKN